MIHGTNTVDTLELDDGERTVELRKQVTPNGERLVVVSDDTTTHLDALALESLTWQDDDFFSDLTGIPHDGGPDTTAGGDPEMQVSNEYTTVRIRRHETAAGSRVSLRSPKMGYECWLSAAELEAVARKPMEFFSDLLETPLGPETDHSDVI